MRSILDRNQVHLRLEPLEERDVPPSRFVR
jgi:hypothetical protein